MAGRFSIEAVFKAVDRVTAPVTRMQNRVSKFTRKMSSGFFRVNRAVSKLGAKIKSMGLAATASLISLGFAFRNILGAGADFEQAITNVGAVGLRTREQIKPLEKLALKLGRTTKFTATQAAGAMEELARAGFSVNDILTATPAVLSAAAASGLEIAEVAVIVSKSLKGMGLDISRAGEVADVLALASTKTTSTIGSLGESLKNVSSTARQFKIPFNDVVAGVALLQDVGLDASVAGSAFNVMLTKMAVPSKQITRIMEKFGISFRDAKGDMLPLPKVLEQLNIAGKKAGGNLDKVGFLAELVGLRGQKAAANLADLFEEGKFDKLIKQLDKAAGSAKKMAKLRMNTVTGSMLLLGSAVDAVKVKIFNLQSGPLKDVVDRMTKWVGINEDLIATKVADFIALIIDNLENIVKWTKRIATGLAVFFAFSIILKTLVGILTLINLVMLANPIVLIVLGIIAAIAAFTALVIWVKSLITSFDDLSDGMKLVVFPLFLFVKTVKFVINNIGSLIGWVGGLINSFDKLPIGIKLSVLPLFLFVKAVKFVKNNIVDLIKWVGELVSSFFGISFSGLTDSILSLLSPVQLLVKAFKFLKDNVDIVGKTTSFLGIDDGEKNINKKENRETPSVISPQERVARSIEESRETSTAEVLIRAEEGVRTEVTKGKLGTGLTLIPSGAF